jgi:sugar phosphate isomerase/epimerase
MIKFILAGFLYFLGVASLTAQKNKWPEIGIVQSMENDSLVHAMGYHYLVESISKCFSPKTVSDVQFSHNLQIIKNLKTKLYALNIFIPGDLKLVGPDINEQAILTYVETVFQRCQKANVKLIIWGSSGARRIPEGFNKEKAKEQFIDVAKKVASLAKRYKVTLALENLNRTETNFINTVKEALEVVKQVDHPNFLLCADIYHMLKEDESASIIGQTAPYLVHCDIAEKENRSPPGTHGENFTPYLAALRKINYKGKIVLECQWNDFSSQGKPALEYLQQQINEVYSEN